MGTELQARGLARGHLSAPWTLSRPDIVRAVHRAYVEAGAQVLLTNTFGAGRPALGALGLGASFEALHRQAVQLAREAARDVPILVAGDIGPLGPQVDADAYVAQAALLVEAGCDLLLLETFTDPVAAAAIVAAMRSALPHVPIVASIAYPGAVPTRGPGAPGEAAALLVSAGVHVVGANCMPADRCVAVLAQMARAADVPLAASPSVLARDDGRAANPLGALLNPLAPWRARLVLLGGCCGTSPATISAADRARRAPAA